ncbi:hypothetical protein CRUP_032432 [Coryphaenoides rupestris]|nr:hypothetical protein CRUP_032432 [Coryphaenoides rupestris]
MPVLIVGATLVISLDKYKAATHCWLNVETDMIWAFVGPVLFVLGVNVVVLCRVVMVTVSSARRRSKMLTPSSASKMLTFDLTWTSVCPPWTSVHPGLVSVHPGLVSVHPGLVSTQDQCLSTLD